MSTVPPVLRPRRIGFDFGDTIAQARNQSEGSSKLRMSKDPDYLNRPAIPGAFESIKKLVELFGPENTFIVSRCSEAGEEKILAWLHRHSFFTATGFLGGHICFCRERHEKGPICAELGITHFVDDRLEVLCAMETVDHRYRLSSEPPDIEIPHLPSPGFIHYNPTTGNKMPILGAKSWPELLSYLEDFLTGC